LNSEAILKVKNLITTFETESGKIRAVDDVSFEVCKGRTYGIVGESGCGKSVTALSIMRLLPKPSGRIENGQIFFKDMDIVQFPAEKMHEIRGRCIAMIFQEPMTALNPVHTIRKQIGEVFQLHLKDMSKAEIHKESIRALINVGIPDPEECLKEYPHHISGGMRQRVMIAMALAAKPDILIADEPTTALDVTIQAQILSLIEDLQKKTGMSVIFITHDLGVIAEICDDVVVMYAGKVAETASTYELFKHPKHPYTKGLLASIPTLTSQRKTRLNIIKGMVPGLDELPDGCRFENRCPNAMEKCKQKIPPMTKISDHHYVSCFLYGSSPDVV